MSFPVFIRVGPWRLHPHIVFEVLAYTIGFRLYLWLRRSRGDVIAAPTRWSVVAPAAVGGAAGSRALYWVEDPSLLLSHWHDVRFLFAGKTPLSGG
jgi:phosphatidylglycerol:prolipoprotein diacylglycerol transferase